MFENFGTAIVQAVGFFGIFGFFIYRLLTEKVSSNSQKENIQSNSAKSVKNVKTENRGLFSRKKRVQQNIEVKKNENKKGWFNR
tara:strand:- start:388 stop:639 length:252 start_codon:yes stop_codon:yes gene_type:complete